EKLLVVDADYHLKGLITVKDIQKVIKYPLACKDDLGRLRVGAAVGAGKDAGGRAPALVAARCGGLVGGTAHGPSEGVLETVARLRERFPDVQLVAGNVGTDAGAAALVERGVDAVKVGVGPGSICTTRIVTGAGVPQLTAIADAARACEKGAVPVIADG